MTKILIVASSLHIGGLEMVIANICRFINSKEFEVNIYCLKELGSIGTELLNSGYAVNIVRKCKYTKNNYLSWLELLSVIKEHKIDILHSHTLDALIDATICRFFNKEVRTVHTFHYGNYPNIPKKYLYLEQVCTPFVDQLVAVGNSQREKIASALNIKLSAIQTVWNGVSIGEPEIKHSIVDGYRHKGGVVIGTVCTLIEQKGIGNLIDVANLLIKRCPKVIFLIAGDGHLRNELEQYSNSLGLNDKVVFLGWVYDAASSFLPHIDIFVLPSLWEAMPLVVLEAMVVGKPVVVTDVGENPYLIENLKDGIVVPRMNNRKMAEEIERLILDSTLRETLGKNAKKKISSMFSVDIMVRKYENLYHNLMREKSLRWKRKV